MKNVFVNNIFCISDGLEELIPSIKQYTENYNYVISPFNELQDDFFERPVPERDKAIFINDLIIMNKEFYDNRLEKAGFREFLKKARIDYPYYLFFSTDTRKKAVPADYFEDSFYYDVSDEEIVLKDLNINCYFFELLFKCMANRKSVHYYIVNSFENIVESVIITNQKQKIEMLYNELEVLSKIDSLTGVLNRGAFFEAMELEKVRTERAFRRLEHSDNGTTDVSAITNFFGRFSCLMIDIDNFKTINDTYGHMLGDRVLKALGDLFISLTVFRDNDIIGRYGGEEFIVVLPETSDENARIPAEKLRNAVSDLSFDSEKGAFAITVSIGIYEYELDNADCESIIHRADEALLHAKKTGKNRVVTFREIR